MQELIETEASERIGADRYERTETRITDRNGSRPRLLATQAGDVRLPIPKLRRTGAGGQVTSMAVVIATGVTATGDREVLGVDVGDSEDEVFRRGFLRSLKERGLHGTQLVISDQHSGLVAALRRILQGASHQRCRVHFARNLLALVPKSHKDMVAAVFRTIFAQPDAATVANTWDSVRDQLAAAFPKIGPLMDEAKNRSARLHRLPPQPLAQGVVDQPAGTSQQKDQTPRPRGRHLSQRARRHPPPRRHLGRHARRMAGQRPPLPIPKLHGPTQTDQQS
jgi:transposase-like protein